MNHKMSTTKSSKPGTLSCLACRNKHLKCDGERPTCRRCEKNGTSCVFVPSRRGINMIEHSRRNKRPAMSSSSSGETVELSASSSGDSPTSGNTESVMPYQDSYTGMNSMATMRDLSTVITDDMVLIFYKQFYPSHPFVLPRKMYAQNPNVLPQHLQAAMRFAASQITGDSAHFWQAGQQACLPSTPDDGFKVQSLLILAVTAFGRSERDQGCKALQEATDLAVRIGDSPGALGEATCVVRQESWRRTCAELHTISAMARLFINSPTKFVYPDDMPFPSPESVYRECHSLPQRTYKEMQERHLMDMEPEWPSSAYEIEAVCILNRVLETDLWEASPSIINGIDASIGTFLLSVPKEAHITASNAGEIDETAFAALILVHLATINLHLPRSDLTYIRAIATSCRTAQIGTMAMDSKAHRLAALKAANAIMRMLTSRGTNQSMSPCFACGITLCFAVQLPAYLAEPVGPSRNMLKEYLQLELSLLQTMGRAWPMAQLVRGQIIQVAQEVLAHTKQPGWRAAAIVPPQPLTHPMLESHLISNEQWLQEVVDFSVDYFTGSYAMNPNPVPL